jgi:hypothetical protein
MGSIYEFHCTGCDYEFEASDGEDCGFTAYVHSMVCEDCQEVANVVTGPTPGAHGEYAEELRRHAGKCPECRGSSLAKWDSSKPCPKCGGSVTKSEDVLICWD